MGAFSFKTIKNLFADKSEIRENSNNALPKSSFYSFKMKSLDGQEINFEDYKGKKVIILNTASKCGFTPQYEDWQTFHEAHGTQVTVLGFPANNFLKQEPGSDEEIASFCKKNYGVSFQLFSKIDVIGENQAPLYQWLSHKELNGWNDQEPTWNFCKYVIDENGKLTHFFGPKILPTDPEMKKALGI